MPDHPRKKPSLVHLGVNSQGKHVYLDPLAPDWAALPPPVATLLELCDGDTPPEELARRFSSSDTGEVSSGEEVMADRVNRVLDTLARGGMLEGTGQCESKTYRDRRDLESASMYLTRACNLRCKYCFAGAGPALEGELDDTAVLDVIRTLADTGVKTLTFLGGEPLARSIWEEAARTARLLGMHTVLLTNGTLVDEGNAPAIAALFDKIQISLDGPPEANDYFRGKGSHDRAVRGMRLLVGAGADVTVSSVVSRKNLPLLNDFIAFLVEEGVARFHCANLQGCGRGRETESLKAPLLTYARAMVDLAAEWAGRIDMSFAEGYLKPPRRIRKLNCGVGRGIVEVDPRGVLYPCYVLMEQDLRIGHAGDQDLAATFRDSPPLNSLRATGVDQFPLCKPCDFRYLCGGGCLALSPDQRKDKCKEYKEFFTWVIMEGAVQRARIRKARERTAPSTRPEED